MKNYWGNWIFGSTIIFVCITFLSTSTTLVSARRTRSSRHHKTKQYDTPQKDEDVFQSTTLSSSNSDANDTSSLSSSTASPLTQKSEKYGMEPYDVCQGWWCGHGRECQRGSDGLPSCICMRECPDKPPSKDVNREGNSNKNGYLEYGKGFEEFYEPFPDSELIFPPDTVAVQLNDYKPVCGSDGKIYPNQCELYRTACITNHPYLHVDDSEESCRHVVPDGGGDGRGAASPGYGGGRDQGVAKHGPGNTGNEGNRGNGGPPPSESGRGGDGNNRDPFGNGPSFLGTGGDFPPFLSGDGNFPNFGGIDIPFGPSGGEGFEQPDLPRNPTEVEKFKPNGKGQNGKSNGRRNEKEKVNDRGQSHGKISTKSTGFGSGAHAAATAAVMNRNRDSYLDSGVSFKNRFNVEDELEKQVDEDESEEDEDDDDEDDDDEDYSGELDGYSFIDSMDSTLLEDWGKTKAKLRTETSSPSLSSRLSGKNKEGIGSSKVGRMEMDRIQTNMKGSSDSFDTITRNNNNNKVDEEEEEEAESKKKVRKSRKKKRKMMRTTTAGEVEQEPRESRWDKVSNGRNNDAGSGGPQIASAHNNLAHDQKKSSSHWHKDSAGRKMDFLKKKSASRNTGDLQDSYFAQPFSSSSIQNDQQSELDSSEASGRTIGGTSDGSGRNSRGLKSDVKSFFPNARRGSSLCSREEYEILKEALLIYNHQHLIGDSRFKKKKKPSRGSKKHGKHFQSNRSRGSRNSGSSRKNDDDEDDNNRNDDDNIQDDDVEQQTDADDTDLEDDSDEVVDNARNNAAFGRQHGDEFQKEYLISLMFAHFDQNNNGKLDYAELQKVGMEQRIERPATIHCHLVDFLRFDDMDHDSLISPNEFYAAFTKLYSMSILGTGKPRSPIHLTARVGEMLEIKCSVGAGSISTVPGQRRKRITIDNDAITAAGSTNNVDDDDDNDEDAFNDEGEDGDDDDDRTGNEKEDDLDYNQASDRTSRDDDGGPSRYSRKSSSSPAIPTTQWYRYGVDVSKLINLGEQFQIHKDGTLLINRVELIHAGNYSCHDDRGNEKVIQPYVLAVQMAPHVKVRPHIKWERPGQDVSMECRAQGEPLPTVRWLKNDNLVIPSKNKYTITGDGITLKVRDINFSDTAAYTCAAENSAGKRFDISSLVVIDEQALPPAQMNESQFLVFHDRGISTYDPENCRLQHQILATDVIPGTQRDYICGSSTPASCEWGRAIRVSSVYVYASQPKLSRVLIISISQMVVVDVVSTDRLPVELHYVPQVDQVWIECWKEEEPYTSKTLQVIRGAKEKKKHRAVRPKPLVSLEADLVQNVFLPPAQSPFISTPVSSSSSSSSSSASFWHAYISHKNTRGLYKMDLRTLRYTKSIDLTSYNCLPEQVHFAALYGFIILECKEPVLHQPTGQLVLDSISDAIITYKADLNGASFLSPDSRKLVTMVQNRHDHSAGTTLLLQHVEANGLRIAFDVNTSLNISDVAFFPSQRFHSYDLYATAVDKEDVLFFDLHSGDVELVPGVGRALQAPSWERAQRPIGSEDIFGKYLVTPSSDAVYVVNGRSHTVNCQIGGMTKPNMVVWL